MAISDADIQAYVQANINDPAAIAAAAKQYGVSLDDLTRATGYDAGTVSNYFQQADVTPYWQQQTQPEPTPAPEPVAAPVAPASVPSYARGGGQVLEDTSSFGSNVGNFGELDYYTSSTPEPSPFVAGPQARTEPTPPPAPTQPQAMTPPAPVATPAPVAQAAPTVTPPKSLVEQILGQGTTSKWTGQGFGSAEANAADMAKILGDIGITDISQFGKIKVPTDVAVTPKYEYYTVGEGDNQQQMGKVVGYVDQYGKDVDPSIVKTNTDYGGETGNITTSYTAPIGTQEVFGNKLTGQAVPNTYGERQTGDAFGGTYAGEGNTGYRVQFDEKGNPFFYTSGQSSSDAGTWMPIVQLALAATGAGGLLGNALLGAGTGAVATNALGNAIISGALTGATGGDVLKGALLGGAGGALGGYLQESGILGGGGGGSTTTPSGAIDGANIDFNDLAETNVIDSLKAQGLSNKQIAQWMENASAADLGYVAPTDAVAGAVAPGTDVLGDFINQQGLSTVAPDAGTINITGSAPAVTPTMVDPSVLAAVTNQLNKNVVTNTPEIKITGEKVKTTETTDTNVPTVNIAGNLPTVGSNVPTVEVVGDKVTKTDDSNVPTVEVVGDKIVKPAVPTVEIVADKPVKPVVPTVEIVADKPVKPVTPEIVVTPPPTPPVPPVPPVIVPPIVLPPPPPPPPPVVTPPVVPTTTQQGYGLNPGLIETVPFYNTTNDAQAKYYWGDKGFQTGPTFDAVSYNAVAAPATPFGSQGVARPLTSQEIVDLTQGLPIQQQQFTPATRVQSYNPALLKTPQGQLAASQGTAPVTVTGPAVPTTRYDMSSAEVQQVSAILGPVLAQALALAMANGDQATINAIKNQYDYALQQQQSPGGL